MNNRLIAFIIAIILAILSAYAQKTPFNTNELSAIKTENALAAKAKANNQKNNQKKLIEEKIEIEKKEADLELPTPPAMEEPKTTVDTVDIEEQEVVGAVAKSEPTEEVAVVQEEEKITVTEKKEAPEIIVQNTVNIGLSAENRQKVATILNTLLADEFVLYVKTLKFHWNVQGIVFHDFHKLFQEQYEKVFEFIDSIAERARAVGALAVGSLQEFSAFTRLQEIAMEQLAAKDMIKHLLTDHESIIRTLRADIEATAQLQDQGTSNFLQDLIVKHEKIAWMLRATLAE